jgi:hypothetical protein
MSRPRPVIAARRLCRVAAGGLAAVLATAGIAAAEPTPIPEGPDSDDAPQFLGAPAGQRPVLATRPPRHPFMAPNDRSNLHNDAWQSDANVGPGPLGRDMRRASTFLSADCASITFDARGRVVSICVGAARPTLMMFDPETLDTLASLPLPPRDPSGGRVFNDFAGGGYFYLDNADRAVVLTSDKRLLVIGETGPPGFAIEREYDLSGHIPLGDKGFSALPDWAGRYWFVSSSAVIGTVDPASGVVRSRKLDGEGIQNSFSVDENGGVYVVTDRALYRFDAGPDGSPEITWREEYPNSGVQKPGQADAGSGTTPTVMEGGRVAITDNADPMNVRVYRTARSVPGSRLVCSEPVFEAGRSATDNSLIAAGNALVVENNHGYTGPAATEGGASTAPGVTRIDVEGDECRPVWTSNERSPTVVPKLSLANGLVYLYTKEPSEERDDFWYLTALDFRSGQTVFKRLAGEGLGFNNNYAPITIGPDNGSVYVGVLGGMVMLRDATPPPRPAAALGARPRLVLRAKYTPRRRAGKRPCAPRSVRASLGGADAKRIASAEFRLGGRTLGTDTRAPFARTIALPRRRGRDRIHPIRARAKLVDGRERALRRDVRACPR